MVVLCPSYCLFSSIDFPGGNVFFCTEVWKGKSALQQMELSSMAILLYLFDIGIFTSCVYGHSKPNLASAVISDSVFRYCVAIISYHLHRPDVYMAIENFLEHYY